MAEPWEAGSGLAGQLAAVSGRQLPASFIWCEQSASPAVLLTLAGPATRTYRSQLRCSSLAGCCVLQVFEPLGSVKGGNEMKPARLLHPIVVFQSSL